MRQTVDIEGRRYVLIEEAELRRLEGGKRGPKKGRTPGPPPFPEPDEAGNVPALEFARVSIARDIARERLALGLTQAQLAKAAGIRQETLSRLESGKHSPTVRTVARIDRALKRAAQGRGQSKGKGQGAK